ncbi:GNAT family N-acetyltransferase [Sanyastnella coralliicola]|uniref:GNAT family N-acetyltransferase n=1 Tax=Sanyastnella coralliicola TaxID=3069118 RepID=UPI0027B90D2A|nr:GNAT family N-acetyltransferase [Longitalea sp. SCSIO 12813]
MQQTIRPIVENDLPSIKHILDSSQLFPSEMLHEMISGYLYADAEEFWFCFEEEGQPIGFGFCAPEKLTEGTYNLYAIAFTEETQGGGRGKQMMDYIEQLLQSKNGRVLIVETSSLDEYQKTRAFYVKCGYVKEAVIREFYAPGEDKVVFYKKL